MIEGPYTQALMEKFYALQEVAKMLKLSERTIFRHLKSGKFKGAKVGGVWRFARGELKNILGKNTSKK